MDIVQTLVTPLVLLFLGTLGAYLLKERLDRLEARIDGLSNRIDGLSNGLSNRIDGLSNGLSNRIDGLSGSTLWRQGRRWAGWGPRSRGYAPTLRTSRSP